MQNSIKTILSTTLCVALMQPVFCQTWDEWFKQRKTQRKYLLEQTAKLQIYLGYLKKGYHIAHDGLTLISDIKNGDFSLHYFFFEKLAKVNPKIKEYRKVAEMIAMQVKIISSYKEHFKNVKVSGLFNQNEIDYFYSIFAGLLNQLSTAIEQLTDVITDGQLEMSDDERIERINHLHKTVSEKYSHFFSFIDRISLLARQRHHELNDLQTLRQLYIP